MREDVESFAKLMSEVMDLKAIERDTRKDPRYMSEEYKLETAVHCMLDKSEQLELYVLHSYQERALKTAVHLANFAMIIYKKLEAGHTL